MFESLKSEKAATNPAISCQDYDVDVNQPEKCCEASANNDDEDIVELEDEFDGVVLSPVEGNKFQSKEEPGFGWSTLKKQKTTCCDRDYRTAKRGTDAKQMKAFVYGNIRYFEYIKFYELRS